MKTRLTSNLIAVFSIGAIILLASPMATADDAEPAPAAPAPAEGATSAPAPEEPAAGGDGGGGNLTAGVCSNADAMTNTATELKDVTERPFQAILLDSRQNDEVQGRKCEATILSTTWALTSVTHCLDMEDIDTKHFILGAGIFTDVSDPQVQLRQVLNIVKHPEYKVVDGIPQNDLAVVQIREDPGPFEFNERVKSIDLIEAGSELPSEGFISGRGCPANKARTECEALPSPVPKTAKVSIVKEEKCKEHYPQILDQATVCAGDDNDFAVCSTARGGALTAKVNDKEVLVGIKSTDYSKGCQCDLHPTIFTKVEHYHEWINTILGGGTRSGAGEGANSTKESTAPFETANGKFLSALFIFAALFI